MPILLLRKRKLRHSLGRPSRSDFVQLEVMALEQRLEAIKNDEPAIFPVTAEEIEDINDAYVEYFGDKYGKQTDNHRYADVYIGQMLWAFLTQENF